ncbi:MAG: hypothetical protein IH587_03260 [Anaerolineae bacterium]|nr:hypothetical protein [Anaerolineae bacterium]
MIHNVVLEETALPPRHVIEHYRRAYKMVNGREPAVRYAGNYWYFVNNEAVHHGVLIREISRLRDLAQKQTLMSADKGIINRIIAKLRGL